MSDILIHKLPNGIILVHQPVAAMVAHCGLMINSGSGDETGAEHGLAHFIEHMLFKGTKKRRAYHVLSRLEDVGGELNAYTTKEETAIHASFLKEDYERAIELISDIAFNSVFPEKELEKEKDVVIEEINSYLDNPAELIFDDFEELIFRDEPIGRNILGSVGTVKAFSVPMINSFINRNYLSGQMAFCSVGNISNEKIIRLFEKYFSSASPGGIVTRKPNNWTYFPLTETKKKDTYQAHCIIGNVAYKLSDDRRVGMSMLNNILGGQGLNSRLNLTLREKNGMAYNVESNYNPYHDTGVFSIYFGTDVQNLEKSIAITMSEMEKLRNTKLGTIQLSKAKSQIKGYLTRGFENHENLMLGNAKSILTYGKIDTIEELYAKLDAVTASELMNIANEIFNPEQLSTLIYK